MLRTLHMIGILVFAVFVGVFAHRIQQFYTSGKLFEQYNSERKASVALFVFSVAGLGVLGYLEVSRFKRHEQRRRCLSMRKEEEPIVHGLDATSIYFRPKTFEKWEGVRIRTSRTHHRQSFASESFWMALLKILVFSMPVIYTLLLTACLTGWVMRDMPMLYGVVGFIVFLSLVAAVGIGGKKAWGLKVGYAIAMIHFLFFPVGTVVGLILLISLGGATPVFALSLREQQRTARVGRQEKLRTA